jgi:hypothetical protein
MSTQSGTYFLGTYGFPIAITMGADLSGATAVNLKLTKPDGTVVNRDLTTTAVTDAPGGEVTYKPTSTEVDQVGGYSFEIKVDIGSTKRLVSDGLITITQDPSASAQLIVEDGTGVENANSYASIADGDAYHSKHLYADEWSNSPSQKKAKALMMATRVIDSGMEWSGFRNDDDQSLDWPRYGIERRDSSQAGLFFPVALARGTGMGIYWPPNEIPKPLKYATCELARELLKADRTIEPSQKGVTQFSLGQGAISATFDKTDRPQAMTEQVLYMLQIFGQSRASRSSVRVERA